MKRYTKHCSARHKTQEKKKKKRKKHKTQNTAQLSFDTGEKRGDSSFFTLDVPNIKNNIIKVTVT